MNYNAFSEQQVKGLRTSIEVLRAISKLARSEEEAFVIWAEPSDEQRVLVAANVAKSDLWAGEKI